MTLEPMATPLSAEDLATARASITRDLCFTATAMAAHVVRALQENPHATTIRLPRICKNCLIDAMPRLVERACGRTLEYEWVDMWEGACEADCENKPAPLDQPSSDEAGKKPRIGIMGNPLIVFDPYMNDNLIELIESLGCTPVLPNSDLLFEEDVRYIQQLEEFQRQGVKHVVYLLSFGCLKGHVQARGALRDLKKQFPDMEITVLDYDPEASALNRENRIRLVAEAAKAML